MMMFVFPIILVVLLYFLLREDQKPLFTSSKKAVHLLDERLSRGEISIEEYRTIKKELT